MATYSMGLIEHIVVRIMVPSTAVTGIHQTEGLHQNKTHIKVETRHITVETPHIGDENAAHHGGNKSPSLRFSSNTSVHAMSLEQS